MTFEQQIWITLLDKFLLAGILAAAGVAANRYLEKYKARQALLLEFAKQRVTRIAQMWEYFDEYESEAFSSAMDFFFDVQAELAKVVPGAQLPRAPQSLEEGVALLTRFPVATLSQEAVERLVQRGQERSDPLLKKYREARQVIGRNRFWLGNDLYKAFATYALRLGEMFAIVLTNDAALKQYEANRKEVDAAREDLAGILEELG